MLIDNKYEIGQLVYLVTDREQLERLVVAIRISPGGLTYHVQQGALESVHYEIEMCAEKNMEYV